MGAPEAPKTCPAETHGQTKPGVYLRHCLQLTLLCNLDDNASHDADVSDSKFISPWTAYMADIVLGEPWQDV